MHPSSGRGELDFTPPLPEFLSQVTDSALQEWALHDLGNAVALDTRLHELEVAFHDAQYTVVIQGVSTS